MVTTNREMRKELEALGYVYERQGGSHELFIHPSGARWALNRGPSKDPKTLLSAAKRAITSFSDGPLYELGTWATAGQIAKQLNIKPVRVGRAYKKGWTLHECTVERCAIDQVPDEERAKFNKQTRWVYRLLPVTSPEAVDEGLEVLREVPHFDAAMARLREQAYVKPEPKADDAALALSLLEENEKLEQEIDALHEDITRWRTAADCVDTLKEDLDTLKEDLRAAYEAIPLTCRFGTLERSIKEMVSRQQTQPLTDPTDPVREAAIDLVLNTISASNDVYELAAALLGRSEEK